MIAPCSFKVLHMSVIKDGIFFFFKFCPLHMNSNLVSVV